ncbi:MAG: class I SAM-dependent methyltransferase [Bacteroidia bacterium]
MTKEFWNERFAAEDFAYGQEPNALLKNILDKVPAGKILFAAEGEGRNAVYAATKGWQVYAFDISSAGKQKAEKLASEKNVKIDYELNSFENYSARENFFDCIALVFSHLLSQTRRSDFRRLINFLKPGGLLIVIGFSKKQLGKPSGGPKDLNMLFSKEQLRSDFVGMKNISSEEIEMNLDEGPFHKGIASLIQFTAVK